MSLKLKVTLLAVLPVCLFTLVLGGLSYWVLHEQALKDVTDARERLMAQSRSALQNTVETAMTVVKPLYDKAAEGDAEARKEAIRLLSSISYGKDGYIFGYDSNVVRLFKGNDPAGIASRTTAILRASTSTRSWCVPARTALTSAATAPRCRATRTCWSPSSPTPITCPSGTW